MTLQSYFYQLKQKMAHFVNKNLKLDEYHYLICHVVSRHCKDICCTSAHSYGGFKGLQKMISGVSDKY